MRKFRMDDTISLKDLINKYDIDIFDFDYPFPEHHRQEFEEKFIDYYYFYDIGFETIDLFLHRLRTNLLQRLPYYNRLYQTEFMLQNPFENIVLRTTYNSTEDKYLLNNELVKETEGMDEKANIHSTFNQDTQENKNKDFTGNETAHSLETEIKDKDLTNKVITDKQENKDKDTTDGGTETHAVNKSWIENYGEDRDATNSSTERFADTPQENFVVGDSNPDGSPISMYSTTVTYDNGSDNSNLTGNKTHTETGDTDSVSFGKTVNETQNNQTDIEVDTTGNVTELNTNNIDKSVDDTANTVEDNTENIKRQENKEETRATNTSGVKETGAKGFEQDNVLSEKVLSGFNNQNLPARLQQFRDTFVNIDKMLIDELGFLFMGVY